MADIVPFPLSRRRNFVARQAVWFAEQRLHAAEVNLGRQLRIQRETLMRRGVDHHLVEAECRALESAIRAKVASLIMPHGGAA